MDYILTLLIIAAVSSVVFDVSKIAKQFKRIADKLDDLTDD